MAEAFVTLYMPGILEYSALSLVTVEYVTTLDGIHGDTPERFRRQEAVPRYEVTHLERMQGKAFRELLARVQQILNVTKIAHYEKDFMLDVTTTGRTILDVARNEMDMDVVPVAIVSGSVASYTEEGIYRVPRTDVLTTIIDTVQSGQLQASNKLPLSSALDAQLRNISDDAEGEDLVLSVGIGLWRAREEHSREIVYADRMHWESDNQTSATWDPLYGDV